MADAVHSIAHNGTFYVRVGLFGLIQVSIDAQNWINVTSPISDNLWKIIWNDVHNRFIAVGENGKIITSEDGFTWIERTSGTVENLFGLDWDNIAIAVGADSTILISAEGIDWAFFDAIPPGETLRAVSIGSGFYTIVGDNGFVLDRPLITVFEDSVLDDDTAGIDDTISAAGSTYNVNPVDGIKFFERATHDNENTIWHMIASDDVRTQSGLQDNASQGSQAIEVFQHNDRAFISNEALQEIFTLNEVISASLGLSILEDILLDDSALSIFEFAPLIDEQINLDDTPSLITVVAVSIAEDITADDTASLISSFIEVISENVVVAVGLNFGSGGLAPPPGSDPDTTTGEGYIGYAVNTSNFAVTKYTRYNFNSFMEVNGNYFGAGSDGLYYLEGADDAGTQLDAAARTGIFDFGTNKQKRIPRAYVGIRGDGRLLLKTVTNEDTVRWYEVQNVRRTIHSHRVKLGRGVKAAYWQFELSNEMDGSFFEVDNIELVPIVLTRKVKC
jgi:hypothetical protein